MPRYRFCQQVRPERIAAAAPAAMSATDVDTRSQSETADFFTDLGGKRPDDGFALLTEIFHLEE